MYTEFEKNLCGLTSCHTFRLGLRIVNHIYTHTMNRELVVLHTFDAWLRLAALPVSTDKAMDLLEKILTATPIVQAICAQLVGETGDERFAFREAEVSRVVTRLQNIISPPPPTREELLLTTSTSLLKSQMS